MWSKATYRGKTVTVVSLLVGVLSSSSFAKDGFTLLRAVPADAFVCIAGKYNAERKFLEEYWDEVFAALKQSGVAEDVMGMIGSALGEEQRAEVDRFKELASRLLDGVNWGAMRHGEMVFAERLNDPIKVGKGDTGLAMPEMVWLIRSSSESTSGNYEGLVGILQTIASEVNKAAGKALLSIDATEQGDAKVSSLKLFTAGPGAVSFRLSVARHGEVIVIAAAEKMLDDVLSLLAGNASTKPISSDARFRKAFERLPDAEDEMSFFDVQALLRPIRGLAKQVGAQAGGSSQDTVRHAHVSKEADELADKGVEAYREQDYKKALKYTQQAHEAAPADSRIMYNLACFNALVGNKDEALTWLEKAVDGGFYAPKKIAGDSDLASLRDETRYDVALGKATQRAAAGSGDQSQAWGKVMDRVMDVPGMFDYVASVQYTEGYAVHSEEVVALTSSAPERPFYPVFGKRKGIKQFDRYLPKETTSFSVNAGLDLNALYQFIEETIRGIEPQGEQILTKWKQLQGQFGVDVQKDLLGWIQGDVVDASISRPDGDAWVLMLKVSDEEAARSKVASAVEFLSTNLQKASQQNPMLAALAVRTAPVTHEKLSGFQSLYVGMSPKPLLWGVADGHLILSTSPDAVVLSLATAAGEHPSIRKNERFMAEALVPDGPVRCISFADRRKLGGELAQAIGIVSMSGGMAAMAIPDPQAQQMLTKVLGIVAKLGPVARKIDFYKSTAEYTTFDGQAWRTRKVTNYKAPSDDGHGQGSKG